MKCSDHHQVNLSQHIRLRVLVCFSALMLLVTCSPHKSIVKQGPTDEVIFPFGVIADCQYCNDPGAGVRKYASSVGKLTECVGHFNQMDLSYVIHLGDFIDRDMESFDKVLPIYAKLQAPGYHVLGNHDFSVADEYKAKVPSLLGLKSRYYDFKVKNWRFIVLDGNDISFHAYPEGTADYLQAANFYDQEKITSPKWNGAIGAKQISWLEGVLQAAMKNDERVVLYCHFPVYPENEHNLWNASEVLNVIEKYNCVKAYLNGHNHAGNYGEHNGIHYLTFRGMVDTEENSYARVEVYADRLVVRGYGREEDRLLKIRR